MERYIPKGRRESSHGVVGNAYIADSVDDALSSKESVLNERYTAILKFPYRAQAMIVLPEAWDQSVHAFIYIPNVLHSPSRDRFKDENYIRGFSGSGSSMKLRVPSERFSEEELQTIKHKIWPGGRDILVLANFYTDGRDTGYHLAYFFNKTERSHPKQYLGEWILKG